MIRRCWISIYDKRGRFLDLHPPPALPWTDGDVIGKYAWKTIAPEHQEGFKAVFAHVVANEVAVAAIIRKWPEAVASLSPIDRSICAGIAAGHLNKQIAKKLRMGLSTVKHHRSQIAAKLGLPLAALPGWCGLHEEWLS